MEKIEQYRKGRDVYVVGVTNVGNRPSSMQSSKKSLETRISSRPLASQGRHWTRSKSHWTMDPTSMIHQGLSIATRWLITWQQKILSMSALKGNQAQDLSTQSRANPLLGGLGRFDFIKGEKQGFTAFFDNELKLHRTKLEGATAFYDKHVGGLLTPPNSKGKEEFPPLVSHEFTIKDKTDLVISGLGWIRVNGEAKVAVWAPEGVAVVTRKAII